MPERKCPHRKCSLRLRRGILTNASSAAAQETNVAFKQKYLISAFGDWRQTPLIRKPPTLGR